MHGLDLLEDALILDNTHVEQLLCSPVLVENVVRELAELLHVSTDEHLAELDEVAVVFVVDLNDTPRVRTTANLAAIWSLDNPVGANDSKRNLAGNFLGLRKGLLVLIFVCRRLEDLNLMVRDVREHLEPSAYQNLS